jgi:hypothetical protein
MGIKQIAKRLVIVAAALPYVGFGCACTLAMYPAGALVAALGAAEFLITGHLTLAHGCVGALFEGFDIVVYQFPCGAIKWANA